MYRSISVLVAAALSIFMLSPACAGPQRPERLVYRIDHATAEVTGRKLTIHTTGAVRTGGWSEPHLRAMPQRHAETDTLVVKFVATPPRNGAAVIHALLPVSATASVRLPRYATTRVKVVSETNSVTADIATH